MLQSVEGGYIMEQGREQEGESSFQVMEKQGGQRKRPGKKEPGPQLLAPRVWTQLGGGGGEYGRKNISRSVEEGGGRLSRGTAIGSWTKMPGSRVRVAHNKVILAREVPDFPALGDISSSLVYSCSGQVWRDVGSQVAPHRVSGQPSCREEEQAQAARVRDFLGLGGVLDRSCPGCGKVMSRQRNLVTHLKVIHGVTVSGKEGREHENRHTKENVKMECGICQKLVSRKSIKRHVTLCHLESGSYPNYKVSARPM